MKYTLGGKTENLNGNTDNVDVKRGRTKKTYSKGAKAKPNHSNGNDYLEFNNLPDYLTHLKKEVGKKVKEEEDAKRKGEPKNYKHKQTDEVYRCLTRHNPRAEANKAIACNGIGYHKIT